MDMKISSGLSFIRYNHLDRFNYGEYFLTVEGQIVGPFGKSFKDGIKLNAKVDLDSFVGRYYLMNFDGKDVVYLLESYAFASFSKTEVEVIFKMVTLEGVVEYRSLAYLLNHYFDREYGFIDEVTVSDHEQFFNLGRSMIHFTGLKNSEGYPELLLCLEVGKMPLVMVSVGESSFIFSCEDGWYFLSLV